MVFGRVVRCTRSAPLLRIPQEVDGQLLPRERVGVGTLRTAGVRQEGRALLATLFAQPALGVAHGDAEYVAPPTERTCGNRGEHPLIEMISAEARAALFR